jgi:NADH dehydrogenase [ubiquinone] 1 alpha subcomplex assembly factor 7
LSPPETPLSSLIRERIRKTGPISVADFMELALNHPEHGYYRRREPFGAAGDFTTAPEISQAFGELLGLWLASAWRDSGAPAPFRLVELGPGRGQLMADLLRAAVKVDGFVEAADLHLIETSERLRRAQRQRLRGPTITWHERFETAPNGPLFLIANEFFDALPANQLIRCEGGWVERAVTSKEDAGFVFTERKASQELIDMIPRGRTAEAGEIDEVSPARTELATRIGERIQTQGGVAAIIDYGTWVDRVTGDTFQAIRRHRPDDPLRDPGEADLTTHVDFRRLAEAAAAGGADVFGPVPQGAFLRALGVEARIAALLRGADPEQSRTLRHALFRLTDASAMGELFKVLVLAAPGAPAPPGFEAPALQGRR